MLNEVKPSCVKSKCEFLVNNNCTQVCKCISDYEDYKKLLNDNLHSWIANDMGNMNDFKEFYELTNSEMKELIE
jgi:hypothetical protein